METNPKLDQDFNAFTRAIENMREEEIKKIRAKLDALRAQALKLAEALTNSSSAS